jgi:CheY-like chemotaxis protein
MTMMKKILLIEDDELDVMSVQRALKKIDVSHELLTAYNGVEALELLVGKSGNRIMNPLPDIILLDINMPKMNGLEFLTILRNTEELKHIKVFVMTTSFQEFDRKATESLGVSKYLTKPLNFNDNNKNPDSMENFVQFQLVNILRQDNKE